ncbi:hypothetical protein KY339_04375 [Candidatus Woesearchaeota archaeon]|nr:hypothetical protein [Candidatus Woesearchaeota archaeon]
MAEKKKAKSVDEVLEEIHKESRHDIEKSFESYDKHTHEDKMLSHFNDIFAPAQDELYTGVKDQLEKDFKEDTEKLEGKKEHVQKAIVAGLRKYFEKAKPSVLKAMDDSWDIEKQYEWLTSLYDNHIGADNQHSEMYGKGLAGLAEGLAKDKKFTAGHLKKHIYTSKTPHAEAALDVLKGKATEHFIGAHEKPKIAAYMKKKAEEAGFEPDDTYEFAMRSRGKHIELREFLKGKKEVRGYEAHGIKKKEAKYKK